MGKYFGTDGIRGVANEELDAQLAYQAGFAAATVLTKAAKHRAKIFIGKDTRISGDMLEAALAAGICSAGADVALLGVIPTPAVAYLTVKHGADAGIVISASHNPFEHNGIKIFGANGCKLSDELEAQVEALIDDPSGEKPASHENIGKIMPMAETACEEYASHIAQAVPSLSGLKVAVDCANGASSHTAELIFKKLGVEYDAIFNRPDGVNINTGCGSTHLDALCKKVSEGKYDLGIAFDGDADRCLLVDENGKLIDGDKIMAIVANHLKENGRLQGGVVVTVMSNLGLHSYLRQHGIPVKTTKVGDRFVLEEMLRSGWNLGGEQSGHVILTDHATTGDGELTAVTFMELLKNSGKKASQLAGEIEHYPQVMINVPVPNAQKKTVAQLPEVKAVGDEIAEKFGQDGRILIRPSGTEALVRVMVEGKEEAVVRQMAEKAAAVIQSLYQE